MVFVVQVDIEDRDLLDKYAKIIHEFTSTEEGSKSRLSNAVIDMEAALAQTLFKGKKLSSVSGRVAPPDWWVTESGVKALFNSMVDKKKAIITQNFADWVGQVYEDAVAVEGKIRQTTDVRDTTIGNITLIGQSKATNDDDQLKYGSGNKITGTKENSKLYDSETDEFIIDATRYSMIDELRNRWSGDKALKAEKANLLSTNNIRKSSVAGFVAYVNKNFPTMAETLKKDGSLKLIRAELEKTNPNKDNLKRWVNTLNNRYAHMSFKKELNSIYATEEGKKRLFDYIVKSPQLKTQFYQKSKNMALLRMVDGKATALLMTFSPADFNSDNFGAAWDESTGAISIFIKSNVEQKFLSEYAESSAKLSFNGSIEAFNKSVDNLVATKKVIIADGIKFYSKDSLEVPHTNSIPMSKAHLRFSTETRFVDPVDFLSKKNQVLPEKFDGMSNRTMGTFLSSEYLRLLVIKNIVNKMPVGPVGGPPLRDDMLTYRTGRFANSVQLMIDYRKRLVRYYYNPIYYIHERTSRNPKVLIENSISEVLKTRFKQVFNISEVGRF